MCINGYYLLRDREDSSTNLDKKIKDKENKNQNGYLVHSKWTLMLAIVFGGVVKRHVRVVMDSSLDMARRERERERER